MLFLYEEPSSIVFDPLYHFVRNFSLIFGLGTSLVVVIVLLDESEKLMVATVSYLTPTEQDVAFPWCPHNGEIARAVVCLGHVPNLMGLPNER